MKQMSSDFCNQESDCRQQLCRRFDAPTSFTLGGIPRSTRHCFQTNFYIAATVLNKETEFGHDNGVEEPNREETV